MTLALAGLPLGVNAASDIWLGVDNLWDTGANWSLGVKPALLDDAIFPSPQPATGGEITLTNGETAASLTFRDFYALKGGTLNLGTGNVTVAPTISARIESALTGAAGLTLKAVNGLGGGDTQVGGGSLVLMGANAYAGGTTIESGKLWFDRDSQLGAAGTAINLTGGTLASAYGYLGTRVINVTGTASKIEIARNTTTTYTTFDANISGAAGTTLTKTGNGSLFLRTANSFQGNFVLDFNAGWGGQHIPANFVGTQLRDNGSFADISSLTIGQGSTLSLDNDAGLAIAGVDRIADTAGVFLKGGTLQFHTKNTQVNDETIGTTTLVSGMSSLMAQSQGGGSAARLFVTGNLVRNTGATVVFQGFALGGSAGDNGRIFINETSGGGAGPTLNDGLIGGWALAYNSSSAGPGGIDFATYKTGQGVGNLGNTAANFAFAGYSAATLATGGPADNVRVVTAVGGVTTRTINSLTMGTAALVINMASGSDVLTVDSGGILNQNVPASIFGGEITSGGSELFVHTSGTATLTMTSRISGNIALVKDLSGTLALNGAENNTYSGGTYINNGSIATSVGNAIAVGVGTGSTLTTGTTDNLTYLGTGRVFVDQAFLTLGGVGATSFAGSEATPTYSATNMAQINIPGAKTFGATEVFSVGAGSAIAGGASSAGQGLNSLTRGTNVFLASDAVVAHSTFTNGAIGTGATTIQNLGAAADLYFGLGANANAGASQSLTIGQGTSWKGISTDRNSRSFDQGTITVMSDFYLQGLMVPGANATLTLGGTGGGAYSIVNGTSGNSPIKAFVIGNVTLNENSPVTLPSNLTFVATPGSTLLLAQANSLGSNVGPAGNAKILLQAGSTLNLPNLINALNGDATFEPGARFIADDNTANILSGTGTMTFLPGAILDITQVNAITGTQPLVMSPGAIIRLNQSSIIGLNARVSPASVFQITSANRTLTSQAIPENLTISGGVLTNGGLTNSSPGNLSVDAGNGKVIIGAAGATFAATTNTTLTVNEDFDLQTNTLTIGSLDILDGNPKRGIVSLNTGGSKSSIGGTINVLAGIQLSQGSQNVLPDLARVNLETGARLLLLQNDFIETIGSLSGSGDVVSAQGGTIPGPGLRIGLDNTDFTYAGSFSNALGNNVSPTKIGTGRMDLTGVSTGLNRMSVDQGTLRLRDGGQTAFVNNNVNRGGTLTLDNAVGTPLNNRLGGTAKNLTLAGGGFNLIGSSSAAVTEGINQWVSSGGGQGSITITPGSGGATTLSATTLNGRSISTFLLRGEKLGDTPGAGVATFTAATANLFGTLVPNNNTTNTQALRPDILSDTPTAGGTSSTLGFVTQDNATNGFRMLAAAEYATSAAGNTNTNVNLSLSSAFNITNPAYAAPLDTQIQSLVLNAGGSVTNAQVPTTNGGKTRFVLKSGGVIVQPGVSTSITSPFVDQAGAYYFHTYGNLALNASLLGASGFAKAGPGTLDIGPGGVKYMQNVGAGMFIGINDGTVNLGSDNSFGTAVGNTVNASDLYLTGGTLNLNGNSQTFRIFTSENSVDANLLPGTGGNLTNSGAPVSLTVFSTNGGNGATGAVSNNLFTGTMTGAIDLVKVGGSMQGFNNTSSFTGTLTLRGGTLQLRDNGQFTGVTALSASYSSLFLDSVNGLTNVNNRLPNVPVLAKNSTIELRGFPGENSSQQFTTVTVAEGTSTLASLAQGAGSADLTIANLVRTAPNIGVNFRGNNLGRYAPAGFMNQDSRIVFSQLNGAATPSFDSAQPVTIANGFLGGWAVVNDGDAAVYRNPTTPLPNNAVTGGGVSFYGNTGAGYPAYTAGTAANFTTGLIVDATADVTLTAGDKFVGAVRMSGTANRQILYTNAGDTLNIESGGFYRSNNNNGLVVGTASVRGRLTTGGTATSGKAELFLHVNQGTSNFINAIIVDNGLGASLALVKDLAGQVDLTGANTFTGGTFVNAGTLRLNTPSADATTTYAVPGPLTINGGTVTLATQGQVKNTSSVTINGGGTLNLSNTAGDNMTVSGVGFNNSGGGTPQITSPSAATAGTVTKLTVLGNITSVNDSVGSTPTIQGTITNTQLQLDFGDNTTTRTIDVSGASPIGLIINAPILNGRLLKTGPGILALGQPSGTGAIVSTYTGDVQVNGGALRIDNVGALTTNAKNVIVGTGATLIVNTNVAVPSTISLALNGAVLAPMGNSITFAGPVDVSGASTIAVNDYNLATTARSVTLNGILSGSGSINIPASTVVGQNGTLLLSNPANSYSGGITLQPAAILTAQSATSVGSTLGTASINLAGGTLNIRDNGEASSSTLVYGNNLTVTGNAVVSLDRPNANTANTIQFGTLGLNGGTLTVTAGNAYTGSFAGAVTVSGTGSINNTTAVSVPELTGTGTFVKSGTATLNVTAPSTAFTGGSTVSGGTLRVAPAGGGSGLGSGALVIGVGTTLQSDPTTGTVTYDAATVKNNGLLHVRAGVADFGTRFIQADATLTGAQPFSAFTERFFRASDVGLANFQTAATSDAVISLENANTFFNPQPGPGQSGAGVSGGTPLNFNQTDIATRSSGYLGTTEQGAFYLGTITIGGNVPAGPITFGTNSDDGSSLYVDVNGDHVFTANERIVNNLGNHAPVTQIGTVSLAAGTYDVAVSLYNGIGGGIIQATFAAGTNVPFAGHYTITPGGTLGATSQIQIDAGSQLIAGGMNTGTLRLNAASVLTLTDAPSVTNSSVATLVATGNTTMSVGANHVVTIDTLNGSASGTSVKSGTGAVVVKGSHVLAGSSVIQIDAGTVFVDSIASLGSTGNFTVNAGGILGGNGDLGAANVSVNSGGAISPGHSLGTLSVGGNLNVAFGGEVVVELGGKNPGDGAGFYDQLQVVGDSSFDQATLAITSFNGFVPNLSDIFYVLVSGGTATGQFDGLAEGAPFRSADGLLTGLITYQANWTGDPSTSTLTGGNDVALYAIPEPGSVCLLLAGTLGFSARRRRSPFPIE